jgi:hypothetical protein
MKRRTPGIPPTLATCTYKGRTYRLLWSGNTSFGRRAKLQFMDASKIFWVNLDQIQADQNETVHQQYKPRSYARRDDMVSCKHCGQRTPGGDDWCFQCGSEDYE